MSKVSSDGGGFPLFRSYHDVRLPLRLIGPHVSDYVQMRYAFDDFLKALDEDPDWRGWFTASQVAAIEHAIRSNTPRILGFRWHHHQDHGVMQLVLECDHRTHHFGGRFTTGGRPR
jgi:hypothetical protein